MKPFLRLRPNEKRQESSGAMCVCCIPEDHPMRIEFTERNGIVKAYVSMCKYGVQYWWRYANEIPSSYFVRPA